MLVGSTKEFCKSSIISLLYSVGNRFGSTGTSLLLEQAASALAIAVTSNQFPAACRIAHISIELELLAPLGERAQPQRIELDEALRVAVIVGDSTFFERHQVLIVERIFALPPDHGDAALVEL